MGLSSVQEGARDVVTDEVGQVPWSKPWYRSPMSPPRLVLVCLSLALTGCPPQPLPAVDGGDPGSEDGGPAFLPDAGPSDAGQTLSESTQTGDGVKRETTTVGSVSVDLYTWTDSNGRPRTVALKREGASHGGYAVRITYDAPDGGGWRTVTLDGTGGGEQGFGYFVAHERYRTFSDASSGTIAAIHGEDDSPLGLGFAVAGVHTAIDASSTAVSHSFTLSYPKWGTVAAMTDVDGPTPVSAAAHAKFTLPVTIQWTFEKGKDFPRVDTRVDLSSVTAGQLAFDMRGPYGVLEFADADSSATLNNVQWGDSAFHFTTRAAASGDLTTQADWVWSDPLGSSRPYHALLARHSTTGLLYELGLVEVKVGADPGLVYSGYSDNRGTTKGATGHALLSAQFTEGEWPFQSAQYAGLSAGAPATNKKFAWGSSSLYGSQTSTQYLNGTLSVPITPFPSSKKLVYRTCVVFGVSPFTNGNQVGLTRSVAQSASPSCATAQPLN